MRLARLLRTSSFRLTLLYAALFAASSLVLLGVVYEASNFYMTGALDAGINSDVTELSEALARGGRDHLISLIEERVAQMPTGPIAYLLEDRAGHAVAGNLPAETTKSTEFDLALSDFLPAKNRTAYFHVRRVTLPTGDALLVGADARQLIELKELVLRTFGWCFAITLLLALASGAVMSGSILRRVESMSRTSREIMAGNLSRRIPLKGSADEFDRLAESLNAMLERTESSFEGMRQVSNDIAHDLRTPLTRLRQRLEFAQRKSQTSDELRTAIARSLADTDAILDTFAALLWIAQIEGQGTKRPFAAVDLSELLANVAEVYADMAEERGQRLTVDVAPRLLVWGDRELLTQLFANLVENAARHSPAGAAIELRAARRDGSIEALVADTGPGIPEDSRKHVFRRFYRLEASRTTPGNGLGLSLVAAIAALHHITLELTDNHPGLRVHLRLAAAAGSELESPRLGRAKSNEEVR